ncbi:hypothetical protein [Mesorhizobium sp.]|uniref:hypothetical protein n=1 Tax=Mesorhizobium sp. TaxID=1871066 RepID=UPI0011F95931|nr:hypothetical protein [Mesorhizobium sp.]TIV60282.1 MAG: hypothetical protein E5V80_10020 [Mesorhizobium sp.]
MDLIRNMVVADRGSPRQFVKGPLPDDLGPGTLDRLRRAGALAPEVKTEPEAEAATRKGKTK